MTQLENTWNLMSKIDEFPEGKRKEKILEFIKRKEAFLSQTTLPKNKAGSFTHILYRGNLQDMVENFYNDDSIVWNLLDDYLKGKEI
jgi:hypothetical protein